MGRPETPRSGAPRSPARGLARRKRGDGRLDPVRRRRPSLGTLLRLVAVAGLLALAAYASWSPDRSCTGRTGAAADPSPGSPTAAASSAPVSFPPGSTSARGGGVLPGSAAAGSGSVPPGSAAAGGGGVPPGSMGVPIRLADPSALSLVSPGNRVDLLRLDDEGNPASVAAAALVLRVTGVGDPSGGLLLALTPAEAQRAVATPGRGFAILIRPG
jgi:hypothetical protein